MTYIKEIIMNRLYSFIHAVNGLRVAFHETNIKIQLAIATALTILGLFIGYSKWEWMCIIICSGLVIGLEIVNTSIEHLCDFVHPEYQHKIKVIKDLAAASVLVAAIAAFGIAIIMLTLST